MDKIEAALKMGIEKSKGMSLGLSVNEKKPINIPIGGTFYFVDGIERKIEPKKVFVGYIELMLCLCEDKQRQSVSPVLHFTDFDTLKTCGDSDHGWYARTKEELIKELEPLRKDMEDDGLFESE